MSDFLPVLLGSDANVYGMARSFYQQYGVRSVAICKGALVATSNTNLVKIAVLEPDLENDETFVKTLTDYAKAHADKPLVLVSCADGYTVLMGRHRDALKPYYHFACPELQTVLDLDIKENFYRACEAHGLSYPKTATCNAQNYKNIELPFAFPVIIKASNSPAYWNCTFPHKKKVFLANNREEFDAITAAIYGSSYQDELILQEYIPGDDNCMRVLNAYCGLDHKVKLMALGRPLLEEQTPEGIGNYAAILSDPEYNDAALLEKLKNFLEDMQWEGFANMDIKYDARTGEYKMFEMNPRQGRSSFVAIHRDTRGLVGHDQIIVFINKFRGGACLQKLRPLLGGQSKLVVQQVNADHIAVLYTGGKGLLFAVQLNFVFPQRLVQPPQPQGRELLHQVFVQPHGQKAFYM